MKKIKNSKSLHLVHEISLTLEFCIFELAYLLKKKIEFSLKQYLIILIPSTIIILIIKFENCMTICKINKCIT